MQTPSRLPREPGSLKLEPCTYPIHHDDLMLRIDWRRPFDCLGARLVIRQPKKKGFSDTLKLDGVGKSFDGPRRLQTFLISFLGLGRSGSVLANKLICDQIKNKLELAGLAFLFPFYVSQRK